MRFYQAISEDFESEGLSHHKFFGSLKEAKARAQIAAEATEHPAPVYKIEIASDKASFIAFMNGEKTFLSRELIYTAEPNSGD
jgi:hypothetical protein